MRSVREIKEEEIPVNISEGPLDVTPPVVSKVEQEDLNIRDQQLVKEEESPWNIREDSDKVTSSVLSEADQEEETNMRSPRETKEEEILVNITEGPLEVKPPVVPKVDQEDLNIRDQQQAPNCNPNLNAGSTRGNHGASPSTVSPMAKAGKWVALLNLVQNKKANAGS
ncbi:uncharacterized protein O3C94_019065 [Discoglossus pictus]